MAAFQTFGQKSCVNRVQQAFYRSFQKITSQHTLDFRPLSPIDLKYFQNGLVKSITVVKKRYTTDAADNAVIDPNELVDVDMSYRAMPKSYLGKLSQFVGRLKATNDAGKLILDDQAYDEASAFVDIAGKRRKIVILGVNQGGGNIDISEDVKRLPTGPLCQDSCHLHYF